MLLEKRHVVAHIAAVGYNHRQTLWNTQRALTNLFQSPYSVFNGTQNASGLVCIRLAQSVGPYFDESTLQSALKTNTVFSASEQVTSRIAHGKIDRLL